MNTETARHHMIQQQLRTCERMTPRTVDMLYADRREHYVPPQCRKLAFADIALPLGNGAEMLTPKLEVRLVEEAALAPDARVLLVGAGSGHLACLLAECAAQVWAVEIEPSLAERARQNLQDDGVHNVTVETGNGLAGLRDQAPFDAIVLAGGVGAVPAELLAQIKVGGKLLAFVGAAPVMHLHCITRSAEDSYVTRDLLETVVPMLCDDTQAKAFSF